MVIKTCSAGETIECGREFAGKLNSNTAVLIYGEMGAGKTHFVKGMAQGLGITDNVTSPTFAIVNELHGICDLYHFDLFRIQSADDLYAVGFYDYIGKGVIAAEWAENIPGLESEFEVCYTVKIEKINENERGIAIDTVRA